MIGGIVDQLNLLHTGYALRIFHNLYVLQFKYLQEAFNHIMARLNDLEEARLYRLAFYEAAIVKVHTPTYVEFFCNL